MSLHETDLAIEAVRPGDDGYDAAARVFFAAGRPALVVRPRSAEQVAAALDHAARHGLEVSVRSGGHSALGHGTNSGGMVIDLTHLDRIQVLDAERRLVRIGGGATWGAVGAALDPRGWALTAGDTRDVGVGGLTLGGGVGWMVRRFGLAIDNLVGARVVTADGRLVDASADQHPDLFWALRGGGGNFGVVVDFDFIAQPVGTVHFGSVGYRLDDPVGLIRRWRDAMRDAPDGLTSTLVLMPPFGGGAPAASVLLCHAADAEGDGEPDAAIRPLTELGDATAVDVSERRYATILEEARQPPGLRMVGRNTLARQLDEPMLAAIDRLYASPAPTAVALRSLGGAFGRVPADATAFAHRDARTMVMCGLLLPAGATDAEVEQGLQPWQEVAALGTGTYLNFQGSATPEDLAAAYPPATYARLAQVKRRYDPANRFARNHNIAPGTQADGAA
ncbi:MAG TPA: FAD-binding oxidoreductase [Nakamurella sp.]|nr:FAD-binding oxidoreductase [Nakamurella sp.]